jgi:cytochrome c5
LNWTNFPQLAQPQWQDGSNNIVAPFDVLQVPLPGLGEGCPTNSLCGPGIRVQIPANSLVDQNGQVPTGNVSVQLSTIDLNSPFQMPGDFSVRTAGGVTNVMDSYGAGSITITAGTKKYNLIAGATAQVTIPIDPAQLAAGGTLPPVIPILFYNETQGLWVEDGTATLSGNSYVATVSHFSSINADTIKVNQSCVRIKSPSLPATYLLEYFIPRPGQAPKHNTVVIDNSVVTTHVIYNLPSSANIVLVPIRQTDMTPIGTFVVNTGAPQNPSSPNLPNDPPTYSACSTEVTLTDLVVPDVPNSGQFLHGLYTFEAANLTELSNGGADDDPVLVQALDQATQNYYQQIDPLGKRLTLDGSVGNDIGFKAANNFGGANDIEINVVYANGGDLGFGRNMHGVKKGSNTAAYVSNYGDIDSDDQTDANDAASPTAGNPVATVAMEYSPIENDPSGDRVVKFYVYNNLGNRVNSANLDKLGNRSVPQLCMVCHGGEYPGGPVLGSAPPFTSVADVKLGSNFLPFDLHYYKFPTTPSGFDKATQQPKFKDFNQMIVKISPPGPATAPIPDIINQMYLGGAVQDETFVVAGWKDAGQPVQESMYRDVISRSCRTCHAAHSFPVLNFDQASVFVVNKLASAESRVCLDHVMPHSKVTHKLFWTSVNPHQPAIFQLFGDTYGSGSGWNGTLCGNFTPGGQAVITPFTSTIQPIFNANSCLNCHVGSTPPPNNTFNPCGPCTTAGACQGLNLSVNAYANLVGHSSDEIPSVQRVKALDHANSYLWRKLDGTQISVGGCGAKMPLGGSLSPVDLNTIGNWIDNGAH